VPCSASNIAPFPSRWLEPNDVAGACATACLKLAGELCDDVETARVACASEGAREGCFYWIRLGRWPWRLLARSRNSWLPGVVRSRFSRPISPTLDDSWRGRSGGVRIPLGMRVATGKSRRCRELDTRCANTPAVILPVSATTSCLVLASPVGCSVDLTLTWRS
jgi:hypothetical protein